MLRKLSLVCGSLLASSMLAQTATAATVYDGITFAQLSTVLSDGGSFTTQADKIEDIDLLYVQGKNHTIAVQLVHCDTAGKCEGVRYFTVLEQKVSESFANKFDWDHDYSKLTFSPKGAAILSQEFLIVGGVTDEAIRVNAASLMYRITQFNEAIAKTSFNAPAGGQRQNATASRADEVFAGVTSAPPKLQVDSRLARAILEEVKNNR